MLEKIKKYHKAFNAKKLVKRLPNYIKSLGLKSMYTVLLLFFAFKRKETPTWAKNIIIGVLGYLLTPLDGIPDVTPFLGMTDDVGVLSFGLVTIACYINDEIKDKAKVKLSKWFGKYDHAELAMIDEKL